MRCRIGVVVLGCVLMTGAGVGCTVTTGPDRTPSAAECPQVSVPDLSPCPRGGHVPLPGQALGTLLNEVAVLEARGVEPLRDALSQEPRACAGEEGLRLCGLRRALILSALGEPAHEVEIMDLLSIHRDQAGTTSAEVFLSRLLLDQIEARRALRARLAETREARDALTRQLEELKAIEQQMRERGGGQSDLPLRHAPEDSR